MVADKIDGPLGGRGAEIPNADHMAPEFDEIEAKSGIVVATHYPRTLWLRREILRSTQHDPQNPKSGVSEPADLFGDGLDRRKGYPKTFRQDGATGRLGPSVNGDP